MKNLFKKIINKLKSLDPRLREDDIGGFTLSELVIVLAILGVMFTIAGNTYSEERKRAKYNSSLVEVLSVIKEARNYSMTSRMAYDGSTRFIPKEGYGVYIERKTKQEGDPPKTIYDGADVKMFVNMEDSSTADNMEKYNSSDLIEQEFSLNKRYITLDGLYSDKDIYNNKISTNKASIIFRPPLADAYIGDNDSTPEKIETIYIVFSNPNAPVGALRKIIKINRVSGFAELISESEL